MIEIFFSYAHEDEDLMNEVRRQLIVHERNGVIIKWHDREIPPGTEWENEIDERLNRAKIILLFMSPHFIESKYCYLTEGKTALSRHESSEAIVIPVILRPCAWNNSPFSKLQAVPKDGKPLSTWVNLDIGSLDVAERIMNVVDNLIDNVKNGNSTSTPLLDITENKGTSDLEYTQLNEAARILYEDLREFDKEHSQIKMAETFRDKPDGVLNYFAITIATHADIFGKRPPSNKLEKLDQDELNRGSFNNGGSKLVHFGKNEPDFIECAVKSSDLPRVLDWLKSHNRFG